MENKIIDLDLKRNNKSSLGTTYAVKALYLKELFGDAEGARSELQKALEYREAGDIGYYVWVYNAYLALGQFEKAREIGKNNLAVVFPKYNYHVDGYVSMSSGNYGAAITNFKALEPFIFHPDLYALAQCYLATEQLDNAIEALQRLQHSYYIFNPPSAPVNRARVLGKSFYLLGKVYEKKGDKKRASESYQELLTLWKDADKDIPELIDAKARVAKLKAVATK